MSTSWNSVSQSENILKSKVPLEKPVKAVNMSLVTAVEPVLGAGIKAVKERK